MSRGMSIPKILVRDGCPSFAVPSLANWRISLSRHQCRKAAPAAVYISRQGVRRRCARAPPAVPARAGSVWECVRKPGRFVLSMPVDQCVGGRRVFSSLRRFTLDLGIPVPRTPALLSILCSRFFHSNQAAHCTAVLRRNSAPKCI